MNKKYDPIKNKTYYESNKDKINIRKRAWRAKRRSLGIIEKENRPKEYFRRYTKENKEARAEYRRQWRNKTRQERRLVDRTYALKNKDRLKEYQKAYRETHRKQENAKAARWRKNNPEKIKQINQRALIGKRIYDKIYSKTDNVKLVKRLRTRVRLSLKAKNADKLHKTMDLVGCKISELKAYLEARFSKGMSWNKMHLWHIDHVIPLNTFDLNDPKQQKLAFHYTNLQPLLAKDNLIKSRGLPSNPQLHLLI